MTIGEKIAAARKKQNMTQEELAYQLSVSRQSVSKWESDVSLPEMDKVVKLCGILDINCDYLLKENADENGHTPTAEKTTVIEVKPDRQGITTGGLVFCVICILFGILLFLFGIITFFAIASDGRLPEELIPSAIFMGVGLVLFLLGMITYFILNKK